MKKIQILGAMCACLIAAYLPSSSYASVILNPGSQPGGDIIPLSEGPGGIALDVIFTSMTPIVVEFDSLGEVTDLLIIENIVNGTATPWSGIDFTFQNSAILDPISIVPITGLINGVFFDGGPVFNPGITTSVSFTFDPLFPELIGLTQGVGVIDTHGGIYSLIITPSAVPVPAAVWLFGSGLIGLIGLARRKQSV